MDSNFLCYGAFAYESKPDSVQPCWITISDMWIFLSKVPEPPFYFMSPIDFDEISSAESITQSQNSLLLRTNKYLNNMSIILFLPNRHETLALNNRLVNVTKDFRSYISKPLPLREAVAEIRDSSWRKSISQRILYNKSGLAISKVNEQTKIYVTSQIDYFVPTTDCNALIFCLTFDKSVIKLGPLQVHEIIEMINLFLNFKRCP